MMRIGWFTTARGPGSLNLFTAVRERIRSGDIDARLSFVLINRDIKDNEYRRRIVRMAEEDGVPVIIFPSDGFLPELKGRDIEAWRDEYGKGIRERISAHPMDFGVLAGYMLIVDPRTCREHDLINLHPALPGTYKGTWEEIVPQVVDNGDPSYGATVHVCSPELDRGAVIAYDSFDIGPLRARCTSREELIREVRAVEARREAPLLMEAIKMIVGGEVRLKSGEVLDPQGRRLEGYRDLSARVSEALARRG